MGKHIDAALMWTGEVLANAICWCAWFAIRGLTMFCTGTLFGLFVAGAYLAFRLVAEGV